MSIDGRGRPSSIASDSPSRTNDRPGCRTTTLGLGGVVYRRDFLVRTGHLVGAAALASALGEAHAFAPAQLEPTSMSWEQFRASFNLAPDLIHMSGFFLASHPKPVRDAIEEHRRRFDENPIEYFFANVEKAEAAVLAAAAHYLAVDPGDIALTDSTTMGLGLLYGGVQVSPPPRIFRTQPAPLVTGSGRAAAAQR